MIDHVGVSIGSDRPLVDVDDLALVNLLANLESVIGSFVDSYLTGGLLVDSTLVFRQISDSRLFSKKFKCESFADFRLGPPIEN